MLTYEMSFQDNAYCYVGEQASFFYF